MSSWAIQERSDYRRSNNGVVEKPARPVIEMLWESDAPDDVLRQRFGFEDVEAASRWVVRYVETLWGVRVQSCERIVMSAHNALAWLDGPSGPMLLKWSIAPEVFPRLTATAELTNWLASRGLAVSAPLPALDGRLHIEIDGVSMGMQRTIDGDLLDVSEPDQVHAAGAALARLHHALCLYPAVDQVPGIRAPRPLAGRVTAWLDSNPEPVSPVAGVALRRLVEKASVAPMPTQLIHGDYRAANILVAGDEVVGILDLEEVWLDHPIMDVARSAVMLGTLFREWGPVSDEVRAHFRAGYESERRLSAAEASWWPALVLWWSLMLTPAGDDPTGWGAAAMSQVADLDEA